MHHGCKAAAGNLDEKVIQILNEGIWECQIRAKDLLQRRSILSLTSSWNENPFWWKITSSMMFSAQDFLLQAKAAFILTSYAHSGWPVSHPLSWPSWLQTAPWSTHSARWSRTSSGLWSCPFLQRSFPARAKRVSAKKWKSQGKSKKCGGKINRQISALGHKFFPPHTFLQSLKKFLRKISFVVYSWSSILAKNVATSSASGLSFMCFPKIFKKRQVLSSLPTCYHTVLQ